MILSAHCTAEATRDSVLGLGFESKRSSVVFKWRATRIPATIASTRLRPSSMNAAYHIRFLFAYYNLRSRSKYSEGVSGPFQTGLSECKKIQPWPNAANINVSPQANDVILQLRPRGGPQNLSARFTEYGDIVGSLFTSNWQF